MWECTNCRKVFKYESELRRHLNRKNPCSPIIEDNACPYCHKEYTNKYTLKRHITYYCTRNDNRIIPETKNEIYPCEYCGKEFTTKFNLNRHVLRNCKMKRNNVLHVNNIIDKNKQLEYENNKLKDELDKMKRQLNTSNITNNNNNINNSTNDNSTNNNINNSTTNNTTNNNTVINIIAHGKEDIYSLKIREMLEILDRGYNSVTELISRLNFNPDRPEYHNVYKPNLRDNYIIVYDGNDWVVKNQDEVLNDMIDNKTADLELRLEELREVVKKKENIKILDKFEKTGKRLHKAPHKRQEVKNDIKLMVYNKKDTTKETRKEQTKQKKLLKRMKKKRMK